MTRQMTYMMLLPSATTASEQAQLTRAFFMQRSQGPFNSLFTGEMRERGRTFLFFVLAALSRSLLSLFLGLWPFLSLSYALSLSPTNTKKKKKNRKRLHRHGRRRCLCRRVDRVPLLALLLQVAPAQVEGHDPVLPQRRQRRGADQRRLQDADSPGAVKKAIIVLFFFSEKQRERGRENERTKKKREI